MAVCLWMERNKTSWGRSGRNKWWAGWLLQDQKWQRTVMAFATLQVTEVRRESVLLQVLLNTEDYPPEWKNALKKQQIQQSCKTKYCSWNWDRSKGNESYGAVPKQGSNLAKRLHSNTVSSERPPSIDPHVSTNIGRTEQNSAVTKEQR